MNVIQWYSKPSLQHEPSLTEVSVVSEPTIQDFSGLWVKNPYSLLLTGEPGLGKTHVATSLLYAYAKLHLAPYTCAYISATSIEDRVSDELNQYKSSNYFIDCLSNDYKMLVIDDLGAERSTEMLERCIFRLVEARLNIPTIITTNLSLDDIQARYGARISSRMRIYTPIHFSGHDLRHR